MKRDRISSQQVDLVLFLWFVNYSIWELLKRSLAKLKLNRKYIDDENNGKSPFEQKQLNEIVFYLHWDSAEDQVAPYPVALSPDMVSRLENCLQQLDIIPVNINNAPMNDNKEISLLVCP